MNVLLLVCLLNLSRLANCHNRFLYSDICYGDLGCYTNRPPFSSSLSRPIGVLPNTPEEIDTRFYLYNRNNPVNAISLKFNVTTESFDGNLETKFIIHGLFHNGFKKWVLEMKDALLTVGDYNVIVVDWSRKNGLSYTQSTANTQVVGAEIARLVRSLMKSRGLASERVHIIGHSLGAHIGGYAGQRLKNLGRITGMDPAGPYFEGTDEVVRLDKTDAIFVDVIHTDAAPTYNAGLGIMQPSGHVDFYPNGGLEQPSCASSTQKIVQALLNIATIDIEGLEKSTVCSHLLSVYVFTDSILNKDCKYSSYPCKSQDDFNLGKCMKCGDSGCNRMGFWATPELDLGSLYLKTQDANEFPYCQHHYSITLNSNSLPNQKQTRGQLFIQLEGEFAKSPEIQISNSEYTLKPGTSDLKLVEVRQLLGPIKSATIKFTKTTTLLSSWLYQNQWSFKNIEVYNGDNQYNVRLCSSTEYLESNGSLQFAPC